jgi:transcriptional regulator with XRE-family HTH domain
MQQEGELVAEWAALLKELLRQRGVTRHQLGDEAGVDRSVVARAEAGRDARLSTREKLFAGLGYRLDVRALELAEESGDLLRREAGRRERRRRDGLCANRRRFY